MQQIGYSKYSGTLSNGSKRAYFELDIAKNAARLPVELGSHIVKTFYTLGDIKPS
jgi:DhnA family fructose-bisphosphate aldolase class Ia